MFTFAVDFGEDFVWGFGPDERVFPVVPAVDESADLADQLAD